MRRCEDEKMFYRPPLLRTLRSDALGKKFKNRKNAKTVVALGKIKNSKIQPP
jgi:hypothetical protein